MISSMHAASLNCFQVWATTGRPATSSQSLSTLAPMRVPLPAATMMAEFIFQSLTVRPEKRSAFFQLTYCLYLLYTVKTDAARTQKIHPRPDLARRARHALPADRGRPEARGQRRPAQARRAAAVVRSEEHTSELQS